MKIEFTKEEIEALGEALDLAHGDQSNYLSIGSPQIDYGDEWQFVAITKAKRFRALAKAASKLGLRGERERWEDLANELEASSE